MNYSAYSTQNDLLMKNLLSFYKTVPDDYSSGNNLEDMLKIITGGSKISLRIVDWFVTNYSKKYYVVYSLVNEADNTTKRFKVYDDYKLKLKAYSKKRFDPFCRWDRISIPYKDTSYIETTIGQLNFFKWAMENKVIEYIYTNYQIIEKDMNSRNSSSKNKLDLFERDNVKTRKKREELSLSASKSIKKELVEIVVQFN